MNLRFADRILQAAGWEVNTISRIERAAGYCDASSRGGMVCQGVGVREARHPLVCPATAVYCAQCYRALARCVAYGEH